MRTTLTLDDDVAIAVERRRKEGNRTFKDQVNELLRLGLRHANDERPAAGRFSVEPFSVGGLLIDVDDVSAALDFAAGQE